MSASSNRTMLLSQWQLVVFLTLAFWLSGSLLLDLVIMPQLYITGMMIQPSFASTGYSIFWIFNRIELICAALILTGILVLNRTQNRGIPTRWAIALSLGLLGIGLVYTYLLTPEMSALGLQLDLFSTHPTLPSTMQYMQQGYWLLEAIKLSSVGALLSFIKPNLHETLNEWTSP